MRAEIIVFFHFDYLVTSMMPKTEKALSNVLNRWQIEFQANKSIISRKRLIYSILYNLVEIICLLKIKSNLV